MKVTSFKVHTIYSKEDILQMEKVASRKLRTIGLTTSILIFVLYLAVVIWEASKGGEAVSVFSFITGSTLNTILLLALFCAIIVLIAWPYIRQRKMVKSLPGGILKANYYFYEKTFEYGWGESFSKIAYVDIEEFRNLQNSFFIKANGIVYWVKKSDFEVGTPEDFLEYMKKKVKCKITGI